MSKPWTCTVCRLDNSPVRNNCQACFTPIPKHFASGCNVFSYKDRINVKIYIYNKKLNFVIYKSVKCNICNINNDLVFG